MDGRHFDFQLKHPFCCYIVGPSQSGKSTLTRDIILRHRELIDTPIERIVYHYGAPQPAYFAKLEKECPGKITFQSGLPEEFGDEANSPMLYILDDLMYESSKSPDVLNAFIKGSHHNNISICFLSQCFFYPGLRPLTLNSHYICLFKNPREMQVIRTLGMQMTGKKSQFLEDAFKDACSEPHKYLFFDLTQGQNDDLRIRNDIFADNGSKVYVKK